MDLANIMLSEMKPVSERQIPYGFTHVASNEQTDLISKIKTHSQMEST